MTRQQELEARLWFVREQKALEPTASLAREDYELIETHILAQLDRIKLTGNQYELMNGAGSAYRDRL